MKKRGGVGGAQDVGTTGGETKDKGKLDVRVRKMTAHATLQVLYKDIFSTMIYMYTCTLTLTCNVYTCKCTCTL